jgi:RNA polymerase sigma-70 factor (ECF subfamily)
MLLHESRRASRTTENGDLIPLEEQDRSQWNAELIREGCQLVEEVLRAGGGGSYSLQAAIAAVHAEAESAAATNWIEIVGLYDVLLRIEPSPIVALNRAAALAMRDGPAAGLEILEPLLNHPALQNYHLAHAARADLLRRLGKNREATSAYETALTLVQQEPERRFLRRRLAEVQNR